MKAAVYRRYGPPEVVEVADVPTPAPKPNELLIRVCASTVSAADWRIRSLDVPRGFGTISRLVFGWSAPRQPILGTELAGVVEAVGAQVTRFKPGDEVIAVTGMSLGGHAEYKCLRESAPIVLKPASLSFEQATTLPFGGMTTLDYLRRAKLTSGERMLVVGASGSVGAACVQLGKHFGAHVTGVCSTANVELVRSLGADAVIDYTRDDFTQNGERYDVIVDNVGNARLERCKGSLADGGRLLLVVADLPQTLSAPWVSLTTKTRVVAGPAAERVEDLQLLADLASSGRFAPPIDNCYALQQIVEAHRRVDSGHKRGSVVVMLRSG